MKRSILRFAICLAFLGAPAVCLAQTAFEEGKRLLAEGQFPAAQARLQEAFSEEPDHLDISFFLGRAAMEAGDFETAVTAFERILIVNPDADRVKLELARCYMALGSRELARQYFRQVLATNPPDAVWQNIQQNLAAIEAAEQRHYFSGLVTIGHVWDDNVGAVPTGDINLGGLSFKLDQKPESDHGLNGTVVLNHLYRWLDTPYSWKSSLLTYNTFYQDQTEFDLNLFGLSTGLVRQGEKTLWELIASANHVTLDDDRYVGTYGLATNFSWFLNRSVLLTAGAGLREKDYFDSDGRDATNWDVRFGPVFNVGRNRLGITVVHEAEDADAALNSYDRNAIACRYDRQLPLEFAIYAGVRYQVSDYDRQDPLFLKTREDRETDMSAGVSKTLWHSADGRRTLAAQVSWTYSDVSSNISLYEYDRHVVNTSLTLAF